MPQDRLRSVVYRSFVTCDDPRGVAEPTTIRKSKSDPQKMEDKIKHQRMKHSSNTSSSYEEERKDKVPKGSTQELQNLSSFQIMEVSREAQKLNEVIDSWSNRTSFDDQSKYIAKDLLKGALDLQESLKMLGKLQEASKYIGKSNKRRKEKPVGATVDVGTEFTDSNLFGDYNQAMGFQKPRTSVYGSSREKPVGARVDVGTAFTDSNLFGDHNQAMDFQKPRTSVDGSSRDSYDELRQVIRESFARQNLLPKVSAKEKDFFDRKNLDFCMDVPSSSSSQSSLIHSHSSDCSPSKVQHEKAKVPNLIAKLMGLKEVPSKAVNSIMYKQMEEEKLSYERRHLLDIDLPRPRKPQFMVQKVVRERRTLEEMIETMQFKELLEKKYFDGSNDGKDHSDASFLRKSLAVADPLIVIMRPLHVLDHRAKELHTNYCINEEKPVKSRQMPRKMREEFPLNALEVPRGYLKFTKIHEKLPTGRTPRQRINKDKEGKISGESPARQVKKTLDIQHGLSSTKINHSKPPIPKVQKKETIVKKIDITPKRASNTSKQAEIKAAKSQESTKTQDLGKSTNLSKPVRGSNLSKCQIARGKTTTKDKHMRPTSVKSSTPKKNLKKGNPESKPSAALVETTRSDDNFTINIASNVQGTLMKSTTSEQITEEVVDASYDPTSDYSGNAASSPCESSGPTINHDVKYIGYGSYIPCCNLEEMKGCKSITYTIHLLLSSASFLSRAEELFDTGTCDPTASPTASLPGSEVLDAHLLLDCAQEIMERKSQRCTRTIYPLSQNVFKRPKCRLPLKQLVGEISEGIEHLRSYSKSCGDTILAGSIYSMLERDLWWNGEVTGAWDLGWRNGFTTEEVNEVVIDVEKLILSEIVDNMVTEFIR